MTRRQRLAEQRFGNTLLAFAVIVTCAGVVWHPVAVSCDRPGQPLESCTLTYVEDLVVQPTCEQCKLPDLPWYLEVWCWLNC